MNYKQQILSKISTNNEVVGIIGLGYVGLPLAVNFAEAGVKVIGFDRSEAKVKKINSGENYIKDIRDAVLREVVNRVKLEATTDFSKMKECDALIICVPTPLDKFRKPDMSYIESACIAIGQHMKPGTFISLESTTYPTTTEDFMLPLIEESSRNNPFFKTQDKQTQVARQENHLAADIHESQSLNSEPGTLNFKHGTNFWLAYSPERVDPGNKTFHTKNTPKVLGAMTPEGLEIGMAL